MGHEDISLAAVFEKHFERQVRRSIEVIVDDDRP